jgi:hypothetical protein
LFGNRFTIKELGVWFNVELKNIGVLGKGNYKNIIFIAHSMGNLVVRSGIFEENYKYNEVKIPLILSLGAPSKGADLATIGNIFFPDNQSFFNLSTSNNLYLTKLNDNWLVSQGDTQISCAYEKVRYGRFGLIVDEDSATTICTEAKWPVVSDHISMVKPRDSKDRVYVWVKNEILDSLNSPKLKNKLNFSNLYSSNSSVSIPNESQSVKNGKIPYESIVEIKKSISTMYSSDIDEFLVKIVPQIQSGITCDDLVEMLSYGHSSDAATVVKKVAQYVRRPFSKNCLNKIGSIAYSSEASKAISALITSEKEY